MVDESYSFDGERTVDIARSKALGSDTDHFQSSGWPFRGLEDEFLERFDTGHAIGTDNGMKPDILFPGVHNFRVESLMGNIEFLSDIFSLGNLSYEVEYSAEKPRSSLKPREFIESAKITSSQDILDVELSADVNTKHQDGYTRDQAGELAISWDYNPQARPGYNNGDFQQERELAMKFLRNFDHSQFPVNLNFDPEAFSNILEMDSFRPQWIEPPGMERYENQETAELWLDALSSNQNHDRAHDQDYELEQIVLEDRYVNGDDVEHRYRVVASHDFDEDLRSDFLQDISYPHEEFKVYASISREDESVFIEEAEFEVDL